MKIKKRHIIVFVAAGIILVTAFIISLMSGPKMRQQPSLRTYEFGMVHPPEDAIAFESGKEDSLSLLLPSLSEANINRGKVYYNYYCVFCHGEYGDGNGPVGESYFPKPAALDSDRLGKMNIDDIYKLTLYGTGHSPVLQNVIKKEHRPYILLYIREGIEKNHTSKSR